MIDARLQAFRAEEAAARADLEAGCRSDLQHIDSLIATPLRKARIALDSLGTQHSGLVARNCANSIFANASVRFRARFRIYAELLADAERKFVQTAMSGAQKRGRRHMRAARQIPVPRIDLYDERSIEPLGRLSPPEGGPWVQELESRLRRTLESNVDAARRKLVDRGERQMLRTLAAVRLMSLAQARQSGAMPAPVRPKTRS